MVATVTYTRGRRTKGPTHGSHGYIHEGGEPKGLHMIATVTYTRGRRTKGPTHGSHGYLYKREVNQRAYT